MSNPQEDNERNIEDQVRRGIANQKLNQQGFSFLTFEIFVVSVVLGFTSHSWIVFGISLIIFFLFMINRYGLPFLAIFLSLGWGFIGFDLGRTFNSAPAAIVLAFLLLIISLALHKSAINHIKDLR
ncbi:hypothetical protein PU629_07380 [Pullulanibacillus sp. KACC 23026]|uniref:hypothetical protein n=1 Tax=Pullulanibacillus sp. KACC 23026 TaxID=3028315 RepID=UPI0023B0EDAF|nr:hypothetical protein [Pullulanibacillus sp. KACC 23026]WEG14179.1 hypothetical protein PU629_07380 [Pullulanibacillus sp. KACC 23026]